MKRFAEKLVRWSLALSITVPGLSFVMLGWLSGEGQADGPGVGLGMLLLAGGALAVLGIVLLLGTLILAIFKTRRLGWIAAYQSPTLIVGTCISLAGIMVASLASIR
jgi:hypothetical protein